VCIDGSDVEYSSQSVVYRLSGNLLLSVDVRWRRGQLPTSAWSISPLNDHLNTHWTPPGCWPITSPSSASTSASQQTSHTVSSLKPNTHLRRRRDSTVELSRVVAAVWTHPSAVVTQFTISCAVELLRLVTDDDKMTSLLKRLSKSIKIYVVKQLRNLCSVSKLSIEAVGSRRELVANCVHTADATQLDSCVFDHYKGHSMIQRVFWPFKSHWRTKWAYKMSI